MKKQINILNLSTGLEFLPDVVPDGFCRLQSSHLESKAWQKFIDSVDNNILYLLSQGNKITIYDCGSRRVDGCSRVIWQGIPLIRYFCEKSWGLVISPVFFRDCNATKFAESLRINTKKIDYFKKHIATDSINIRGEYKLSLLDGR